MSPGSQIRGLCGTTHGLQPSESGRGSAVGARMGRVEEAAPFSVGKSREAESPGAGDWPRKRAGLRLQGRSGVQATTDLRQRCRRGPRNARCSCSDFVRGEPHAAGDYRLSPGSSGPRPRPRRLGRDSRSPRPAASLTGSLGLQGFSAAGDGAAASSCPPLSSRELQHQDLLHRFDSKLINCI